MSPPTLPEFTEPQRKLIKSHLPGLFRLIDRRADTNEITRWKKATIEELLKHDLLARSTAEDSDVDEDGHLEEDKRVVIAVENGDEKTPAEVSEIIDRYYLNQGSYHRRKGKRSTTEAVPKQHPHTASVVSPNPTSSVGQGTIASNSGELATLTNDPTLSFLRTLIVFQGQMPSRELFIYENQREITAEIESIRKGMVYEEKIKALAEDISLNQAEFAGLLLKLLNDVCDRGYLGSALFGIMYAFRDPDSDNLKTGLYCTGHNSKTSQRIKTSLPHHNELLTDWEVHADTTLPRFTRLARSMELQYRDGIALLPHINLHTANFGQLAAILDALFKALWDFAWGSNGERHLIPYADIEENPDIYYDTGRYPSISIGDPSAMSTAKVVVLWTEISNLCDSMTPLQFYPRAKIESNIIVAKGQRASSETNTSPPRHVFLTKRPTPSTSPTFSDDDFGGALSPVPEESGDEEAPIHQVLWRVPQLVGAEGDVVDRIKAAEQN
ncbi:hypothetical protein NMY22_g9462 [Coprinellus aureogranulatus]|nr:hypothetical protein NMY22_g9462 [Coprinellus aureogranulatus]